MNLSEGHPLHGKTMTLDALQRIILKSPAFRPTIEKMLDYIIEKRRIRSHAACRLDHVSCQTINRNRHCHTLVRNNSLL